MPAWIQEALYNIHYTDLKRLGWDEIEAQYEANERALEDQSEMNYQEIRQYLRERTAV